MSTQIQIASSGAASGGLKHGIATGTNTYAVTITGVAAYTDGDAYAIRFTNGNDADSTININGLGVKTLIKEANIQVTGGDIVSGQELIIIYDGTNFQCVNVAPNQLFAFVTNDDSVTITKGQPVYAFGSAGNRMSVKLAANTADATSAQTIGVVFSSSIAPNQRGFIITQGVIDGINTGMYSPGNQLYLGATAGSLTNVKPFAPNHLVYIGIVERANAGNGQIYIKPQNGYELDELHDVYINPGTLANNDALIYESATQLWKNKPVTESIISLSDITTNDVSTTKHGFAPKAPNDTTKFLRGDGTWANAGLQYFTEAQSTAAPNATTPVDSLTAVSAATNADFAIKAKGNGAILANIPDSTSTGGDKRGTQAVDLQMARITSNQVASGVQAVIVGGERNRASNTQAVVVGGNTNLASGQYTHIGGGASNTASADYANVGGGVSNTASGSVSVVAGGQSSTATAYMSSTLGGLSNVSTNQYASNLGGQSNTSSGSHSTVIGGSSNTASGNYSIAGGTGSVANANNSIALGNGASVNIVVGRNAFANQLNVIGDAQTSKFILRKLTTNATPLTLTSDASGGFAFNQVTLPNNSAFRFKGTIIGKQTASTNHAAWDIDGLIVRGTNAAATTLSISNVTLVQNTPAWGTPTLAANTSLGCLQIQVTGAASTNIVWVAIIETTEVIYA